MQIKTFSEKETILAGEKFAETLVPGNIIGLKGELGSGKTQFVKGICNFFNVSEKISSPTFIIVNDYPAFTQSGINFHIYHFDLYRLESSAQLTTIGFEEYIQSGNLILIEWCDLAEEYLNITLPKVMFFTGEKENERIILYD